MKYKVKGKVKEGKGVQTETKGKATKLVLTINQNRTDNSLTLDTS